MHDLGRSAPAPAARQAEERPSRLGLVLGLAAALALAIATYHVVTAPRQGPPPSARAGRAATQPVEVASIARGDIRVVLDALGTVTPLAAVTVKSQVSGQLVAVGFKEGQDVHKGDFLAEVDQRPFAAAEAQFQGQLERDQAQLKGAQIDLVRYQTLADKNYGTRQQADDQFYLVQQYQGTVKLDQALVDAQKLNLAYCHIVAPIDGRIGLRQVDPGNYVQVSDASGIVVITQMQPISVIFTLAEDDLAAVLAPLKAGKSLAVVAYDRSGTRQIATGTLSTVDNQIDPATGTVKLRAQFDNADEALFPNQFVNVKVLVETRHDVVTVPVAAVQNGAPGAFVYRVEPGDVVAVKPVTLGPADGGMVEVTGGLAAGDRVVIDGTDRLRDGTRVAIAGQTQGQAQGQPPFVPAAAARPAKPAEASNPAGDEQQPRRGRRQH